MRYLVVLIVLHFLTKYDIGLLNIKIKKQKKK